MIFLNSILPFQEIFLHPIINLEAKHCDSPCLPIWLQSNHAPDRWAMDDHSLHGRGISSIALRKQTSWYLFCYLKTHPNIQKIGGGFNCYNLTSEYLPRSLPPKRVTCFQICSTTCLNPNTTPACHQWELVVTGRRRWRK